VSIWRTRRAAGAQRGAHAQLMRPLAAAGIGGVAAGDEEHKEHRAHEEEQKRAGRALERLHEGFDIGIPALAIGDAFMERVKLLHDGAQICCRLGWRNAVFKPGERVGIAREAAIGAPRGGTHDSDNSDWLTKTQRVQDRDCA
jgi:hypothetical protein